VVSTKVVYAFILAEGLNARKRTLAKRLHVHECCAESFCICTDIPSISFWQGPPWPRLDRLRVLWLWYVVCLVGHEVVTGQFVPSCG